MSMYSKARGQGMTEYIVIVALIGVAAIGAYSFLGQSIRGATAGLALEIAGEDAKGGIDGAIIGPRSITIADPVITATSHPCGRLRPASDRCSIREARHDNRKRRSTADGSA